jgi:hypothetical protein
MLVHGATINQNVVYVDDHKIIKPFAENVIHESAKCCGCIGSPKGITKNLYEPYLVRQAVFSSSPSLILIW